MNNEPVSQDYKRGYNAGFEAGELNGKHLAQAKTLTDEEITEVYNKVYEEGHDNQVIALARAILRKAQEK